MTFLSTNLKQISAHPKWFIQALWAVNGNSIGMNRVRAIHRGKYQRKRKKGVFGWEIEFTLKEGPMVTKSEQILIFFYVKRVISLDNYHFYQKSLKKGKNLTKNKQTNI